MAVVNGRLVLPGGVERSDLMIREGRIAAVGELPAGWTGPTIDARQMLVAPGFLDLQINGGYGADFTADGETIWDVASLLPRQGVTSFLPTVVTAPPDRIGRAQRAIASPPADGCVRAAPLGLHLEGPMLNPVRRGAHVEEHLRDPSAGLVDDWHRDTGIAMVTIAPELTGAPEMIGRLSRRGITVAAGHSDATVEQAADAVRAGVSHITHLYNAMSPLHHRKPGLVGFALARRDITAGIVVDGVHCDPTAVAAAWNAKGNEGLALVTDACALQGTRTDPGNAEIAAPAATGTDEGAAGHGGRRARLGPTALTRHGKAVRNEQGTLAGSLLTMPEAVRNLVEYTGCGIAEAVAAATATPAGVIGAGAKGVLAPGRDADVVLLDGDLHVALTIIGGRIAYDPLGLSLACS